jgi:hypothetical protein
MSTRSALIVAALVAAASSPTVAQSGGHVEVTGFGGWVFSDGVEGTNIVAGDGNIYDRIDPKDSGSYGFSVGVMTTDHVAVGFMYVNQLSQLLLGGTAERTIGDMNVKTYHGYVDTSSASRMPWPGRSSSEDSGRRITAASMSPLLV